MNDAIKKELVTRVVDTKDWLLNQPGFRQDVPARSIFVALLTIEGALMFDDEEELGKHCVEFAEKKHFEHQLEGYNG